MARPDEKTPLRALLSMLETVEQREEKAATDLARHQARKAELLAEIDDRQNEAAAEIADAKAALKKKGKK